MHVRTEQVQGILFYLISHSMNLTAWHLLVGKASLSTFSRRTLCNRHCSIPRSFDEIPGPKTWPVVGNALLFSPLGPYKVPQMLDAFLDLFNKHGPIVRLIMAGKHSILLFNPDDIRTFFQHEGKYPKRPTFEALKTYRAEKYGCVGLVPDNGEEWYRLRKHVQNLLKLKTVHSYWSSHHAVANDFADHLRMKMDKHGVVHDFLQEAFLFSLEAIGILCYGKRLQCLTQESQEASDIVEANEKFLKALGETFNGPPVWKLWKNKAYKTIESTQDFMMVIGKNYLTEAEEEISRDPKMFSKMNPALFEMLISTELTDIEKRVLITELFQGGIDATGTVLTMILRELALNQDIQKELFEILVNSTMTPGHIPPLLRAVMKETLRLHPTAAATSRFLDSAAVLSGFEVPENTLVIGVNPVISRMASYFKDPDCFNPKRWVQKDPCHAYGMLPFGHGARMCPGRRIAEQEILICISQIIKKFKIVASHPSDIKMVLTTNLVPSEPISLQFKTR